MAGAVVEFAVGSRQLVALEDLESYAGALWHELPRGAVVWLTGDLGSGKTAFVSSLTSVLAADAARSPTFALVHEYSTSDGMVAHVDCYRLRSAQEAIDIDFPELTRRARAVFVEWPDRGGGFVPGPDAHVSFAHADNENERWLERIA